MYRKLHELKKKTSQRKTSSTLPGTLKTVQLDVAQQSVINRI